MQRKLGTVLFVAVAGLFAGLAILSQERADDAAGRRRDRPTAAPPASRCSARGRRKAFLGKEVRSSADENMGRIVDVIVDRDGRVRAAVIDFGGFLGVGSRKIVVDWNALQLCPRRRASATSSRWS